MPASAAGKSHPVLSFLPDSSCNENTTLTLN